MGDLSINQMQKSIQSLMEIMTCPVCLMTLRRDLVQCVNGHLLCFECQGDLPLCPTCRCDFSDVIPTGMIPQVLEALPPRCRHKDCEHFLETGDDHEKYCCFKRTNCKIDGCQWKGQRQGILEHFQQEHFLETVLNETNNSVTLSNFDPNQNKRGLTVWAVESQFFWHEIINDPAKKLLVHTFHFIPNGKPKIDFICKVSYSSKNNKFITKMKLNLDPDISSEDNNCIVIPKHMLPHFIDDDNNLINYVNIKKCSK